MFTRSAILVTCVLALSPARAADEKAVKDIASVTPESVIAERRAASDAANNAVNEAMAKAAQMRAKHDIVDRDPESQGGVAGDKKDPKVREYLRLKDAYLNAKAASERAYDALTDVLPMDELRMIVEAGDSLAASSFEEMAKLLQSGEITDVSPEDRRSEVAFLGNVKAREIYLRHKGRYIAGRGWAAKARAALANRKEK